MTKFDEMVLEELNMCGQDFEEAISVLENNEYCMISAEDTDGDTFALYFEYEGEEETDFNSITLLLIYNDDVYDLKLSEDEEDVEKYDEILESAYDEDWSVFADYVKGTVAECELSNQECEWIYAMMTKEEYYKTSNA